GVLLLLALSGAAPLGAQTRERQDRGLQRQLDSLVRGFRGTVGIYVRHLGSGRSAAINPDTVFPTASMIKVPILVGTFDALDKGLLQFDQELIYTDSLLYPGEDLLGGMKDSSTVPLSKLTLLMITTSDNTASLWLQALAGTGSAINAWLAAYGFDSTRVNSRTPGREASRTMYGWGQTTPREMANLLVMIREGRAVSRAASEEMYRHLTRSYYTAEALSALPPWVQAASKVGAVDRSRSEVVLVNGPSGDYVFCVITKGQEDTSWDPPNEGWVLIRRLSALLWNHFEPKHPWQPAEGATRFKP
ncbi:MAG: serine hydrolase, partial [Gemmatimonadota bacterium]|nr:serine hydrolase [Gemmatimonadota bacterium]